MRYFYISYLDREGRITHDVVKDTGLTPLAFIGTIMAKKGYDPIILYKEEVDERQYNLFNELQNIKRSDTNG